MSVLYAKHLSVWNLHVPWCSSPLVDIFVQGIRIEWHVFVLVEFCLNTDIVGQGVLIDKARVVIKVVSLVNRNLVNSHSHLLKTTLVKKVTNIL